MSTTEDRTAGLRAARTADSTTKRDRALSAIEALEAAGSPITATAVAKAAGVSTWLVYSDGIREHFQAARARHTHGDPAPPPPPPHRPGANRSARPACAPTWPSPTTRSADSAPSTSRSASGYACNSAPKSKHPTTPN